LYFKINIAFVFDAKNRKIGKKINIIMSSLGREESFKIVFMFTLYSADIVERFSSYTSQRTCKISNLHAVGSYLRLAKHTYFFNFVDPDVESVASFNNLIDFRVTMMVFE